MSMTEEQVSTVEWSIDEVSEWIADGFSHRSASPVDEGFYYEYGSIKGYHSISSYELDHGEWQMWIDIDIKGWTDAMVERFKKEVVDNIPTVDYTVPAQCEWSDSSLHEEDSDFTFWHRGDTITVQYL